MGIVGDGEQSFETTEGGLYNILNALNATEWFTFKVTLELNVMWISCIFPPNKIKANGCIFQAVIQRLFESSIDKPGTGGPEEPGNTCPFFPAGWAHIQSPS